MSDPQTPNVGFYIPINGADVGSWNEPCNANYGANDSLAANVAAISLSSSPVTLSTPPSSGSAWSGPYQSQSALLRFSGTITANIVVTIPRAGFYIVENLCAGINTYYVQLTTGSGNTIGAIPGKKCHVFSDGTNMDYVDLLDPGQAYDLHGYTALPTWMSACTILPYLIKDGSSYATSSYPNLFNAIGYTYGGSGANFNVPDERARVRAGFDSSTNSGPTNRMTTAISGVNGATMGSAGGSQSVQAHTHSNTLADPGHRHSFTGSVSNGQGGGGGPVAGSLTTPNTNTATTGITITNASYGAGSSQNVQPSIVSVLPLIKT